MPEEVFEVDDKVYLPQTKHFGTVVRVRLQKPFNRPNAADVRSYDIKLDDGATISSVFRGLERVQG